MVLKLNKWILSSFIIILCIGFSPDLIADQITNIQNSINIDEANKMLDDIEEQVESMRLYSIQQSMQRTKALAGQSDGCVATTTEQLDVITKMLESFKGEHEIINQSGSLKYLNEKMNIYKKQRAECLLIKLKSSEILLKLKASEHKLRISKTLKKTMPIWDAYRDEVFFTQHVKNISTILVALDARITLGNYLNFATIILFCGFFTLLYYHYKKRHSFTTSQSSLPFQFISYTLEHHIPIIISLLILSAFVGYTLNNHNGRNSFLILFHNSVVFILYISLANFITSKYSANHTADKKIIRIQVYSVATVVLFGYALKFLLGIEAPTYSIHPAINTTFVTLVLFGCMWVSLKILNGPFFESFTENIRLYTKVIVLFLFGIVIACNLLGYNNLASLFISNINSTFLLFLSVYFILHCINSMYNNLQEGKMPLSRKLRNLIGIKYNRPILEIFIIKSAIYVILAVFTALYFMKIWKFPITLTEKYITVFNQITISEATIFPFKIIVSFIVFAILMIANKATSTAVAKKYRSKRHAEEQVAVASIFNYFGIIIALLIALIVSGINFTGLAIILGALSVGMGFGLQNIVNNFISGLVLLLQRPIKSGDRILFNEIEGFVKSINVLSTRIKTLSKEDIIIPNSELTANPVTNYMLHDQSWRLTCEVGIEYGSNIELVKKTLLDVAKAHPDVCQEEPNQPVVLFRNFSDSSLDFELWCVILDVNKKHPIKSELYFAINKAFAEQGITIPFPQRDVHIKK